MARHFELLAAADAQEAQRWLVATPLIDLEDPKLRLRVRALTQLCRNEREKALALYGFVKRLRLVARPALRRPRARQAIPPG